MEKKHTIFPIILICLFFALSLLLQFLYKGVGIKPLDSIWVIFKTVVVVSIAWLFLKNNFRETPQVKHLKLETSLGVAVVMIELIFLYFYWSLPFGGLPLTWVSEFYNITGLQLYQLLFPIIVCSVPFAILHHWTIQS